MDHRIAHASRPLAALRLMLIIGFALSVFLLISYVSYYASSERPWPGRSAGSATGNLLIFGWLCTTTTLYALGAIFLNRHPLTVTTAGFVVSIAGLLVGLGIPGNVPWWHIVLVLLFAYGRPKAAKLQGLVNQRNRELRRQRDVAREAAHSGGL